MGNIFEDNIFNKNNDNKDTNNSEINSAPQIDNERIYVWMDPEINNEQNKYHYEILFKNKNIDCKKFDNVNEGFNFLNEKQNDFKEIIIIISGKLFNDLYYRIKNNLESILFSPTIIVFTGKINLFKNQLKMNNLYYNNDLFDTRLIFTNQIQLEDFINHSKIKGKELTFEKIDNIDQLIIPIYYSYLLEDVNKSEIDYFNNFVDNKFSIQTEDEPQYLNEEDLFQLSLKLGNKKLKKLINQIKDKKIPKEIIIKYWLRIYSSNSEFYKELNKSLRNADNQAYFYHPFIKLCYEGIRKGFLKSYNKEIYRCSNITKQEFRDIQNYFSKSKNKYKYPSIIVYSRSFLSFSEEEKYAKRFIRNKNDNYSILYIIEEIKDIKNFDNKLFNANLEKFSIHAEKEMLVFPFAVFEIVDINEIAQDGIDYQIRLKYLGNYSKYLEKELGKNYLNKIPFSKFSDELIESGLFKNCNFFSNWIKKKTMIIKLNKISFFLEGEQDCVSFKDNIVYIFNIETSKIKHKIDDYQSQILDIIKLKYNRICVFYKDGTLKIMKLYKDNEIIEQINSINIYQNNLTKVIFLENENFLCVDIENNFKFFDLEENKYNYKNNIAEEDEILIMKGITNERIVYITKDKDGKKYIKFIDLKKREKEEYFITIKEEKEKLQIIDLIIFNEYIIICYNSKIDIINYKDKELAIKSLKFFDYEITNIMQLSSDRIIIGLYDPEQNQSIIREHVLRVGDLKKNLDKFDCIGQGKLKLSKIENILKINDSHILINTKDNCMIYKKKNKVIELIKENLLLDIKENKIIKEEEKEENNNIIQTNRKKNDIYKIKKAESSNIEYNNPLGKKLNFDPLWKESKQIITKENYQFKFANKDNNQQIYNNNSFDKNGEFVNNNFYNNQKYNYTKQKSQNIINKKNIQNQNVDKIESESPLKMVNTSNETKFKGKNLQNLSTNIENYFPKANKEQLKESKNKKKVAQKLII